MIVTEDHQRKYFLEEGKLEKAYCETDKLLAKFFPISAMQTPSKGNDETIIIKQQK